MIKLDIRYIYDDNKDRLIKRLRDDGLNVIADILENAKNKVAFNRSIVNNYKRLKKYITILDYKNMGLQIHWAIDSLAEIYVKVNGEKNTGIFDLDKAVCVVPPLYKSIKVVSQNETPVYYEAYTDSRVYFYGANGEQRTTVRRPE